LDFSLDQFLSLVYEFVNELEIESDCEVSSVLVSEWPTVKASEYPLLVVHVSLIPDVVV